MIEPNPASGFINLLTLYLLGRGRACSDVVFPRERWSNVCIFIGISCMQCLLAWLSLEFGMQELRRSVFLYKNPFIHIQAVALLMFILSFSPKQNKFINIAGRSCLSIYLITELLFNIVYKHWAEIGVNYGAFPLLLYMEFCCIVCIIVDQVRLNISNKIVERLSKIIKMKYEKTF